MILCAHPKSQYLAYQTEIDKAIGDVLDQGRYILGQEVKLFEEEFARYVGVSYCVGVGSATEALHLSLKACGVGHGDEVITVAHTAVATVAAIAMTGATAVLVDIEPKTYTMDPVALQGAITLRTKAIIAVHIYGHPADMTAILNITRKHGIKLIEDCAQAHGAKYDGKRVGSFGDISCFSFYPTKNLGCIGDGGAIVTNDAHLADQCRLLREYGWSKDRVSQLSGWNSRLDELQAAILRVKLPFLDRDNGLRVFIADQYDHGLSHKGLTLPSRSQGVEHVFHLYVIRTKRRDELKEHLASQGIQAMIHYPVPVHLQPGFAGCLRISGSLAETEIAAKEILSLPMYPQLSRAEVTATIEAVTGFLRS